MKAQEEHADGYVRGNMTNMHVTIPGTTLTSTSCRSGFHDGGRLLGMKLEV